MARVSALTSSSVTLDLVEQIRRMIVLGEIPPGERIPTRELEERFDVSHIPIREALRQLEAEQLVVSLPRRGAISAPVSAEQAIEVYDVRRMIEPEVAYRAAKTMSDSALRTVHRRLDALDKTTASSPVSDRFLIADRAFHWAILQPAASPVTERILKQLWRMSERYIRLGMTRRLTVDLTHEQHHQIFGALEQRDAAKVRQRLAEHLSLTQASLAVLSDSAETATETATTG